MGKLKGKGKFLMNVNKMEKAIDGSLATGTKIKYLIQIFILIKNFSFENIMDGLNLNI